MRAPRHRNRGQELAHDDRNASEERLFPRQAADTPWRSGGLRDFFLYKDLGIEAATGGQVIAQLVKANQAPEKGTGWHRTRRSSTSCSC
jgi:hypothetical protein